ncbi:hypothetical protein TSAR_002116 [Trichomalopsis sarcophagae]|uniref:Uncharacterized protein n=1 Tax=Trichomalopsis sarcophagae TaxID=543379 RepID=A0A232FGC3_9HYME|nr:hypothetical protein TSAR_002116 [Trichomalopsis sarcophagae]
MDVCVHVYRNISPSISIKFDMHIYFWILNSKKNSYSLFSQLFFYGHLLIFEKHYFAFFFNHSIGTKLKWI